MTTQNNAHTPFPFSVGFPLSIKNNADRISICGANRGDGWPILCEVPNGPHAARDAENIVKACSALLDEAVKPYAASQTRIAELERALTHLIQAVQMGGDSMLKNGACVAQARAALRREGA